MKTRFIFRNIQSTLNIHDSEKHMPGFWYVTVLWIFFWWIIFILFLSPYLGLNFAINLNDIIKKGLKNTHTIRGSRIDTSYLLGHYAIHRPNSPALNGRTIRSVKCVVKNFFVFHSNSMKVVEDLVHIDYYNFTNFHWIQMKNRWSVH